MSVAAIAGKAVAAVAAVVLLVPAMLIALLVISVTLSHRARPPVPLAAAHNASAVRSAGCGGQPSLPTGQLVYQTVDVDGLEREYLLWLPASYDPDRPYPLLLSLHGATNSPVAQAMQDQLHCLADAAPYVVAWPAGYHRDSTAHYSSWNAPGATAPGDSPDDGAPCIVNPLTGPMAAQLAVILCL
jgi:poly(3-hydroxybutyrate) depolymerase